MVEILETTTYKPDWTALGGRFAGGLFTAWMQLTVWISCFGIMVFENISHGLAWISATTNFYILEMGTDAANGSHSHEKLLMKQSITDGLTIEGPNGQMPLKGALELYGLKHFLDLAVLISNFQLSRRIGKSGDGTLQRCMQSSQI